MTKMNGEGIPLLKESEQGSEAAYRAAECSSILNVLQHSSSEEHCVPQSVQSSFHASLQCNAM